MSSGTTRPSTYAEKRSSGIAVAERASARPRMSDSSSSFRTDASKPSEPKISSRYAESAAHKRSISGNPNARSTSRSAVEERRTEKVQVTTRETLMTRTMSPERRGAPSDKGRAADGLKRRPSEPRPRDARQETPLPQGMPATHLLPLRAKAMENKINPPPSHGIPRRRCCRIRRHP